MCEFWDRKMKTAFYYMDVNKDGVVSKEDFMLFADRLCKSENADPERQKVIQKRFIEVWRHLISSAGPSDDDVSLTEAMLIESLKTQKDDPTWTNALLQLWQGMLQIFDTNLDGFLQPDEYRRFFEVLGIQEVDRIAKVSFEAVDINHDGKLSKEEIGVASLHFTTSDDESSPYKYFFGPLLF